MAVTSAASSVFLPAAHEIRELPVLVVFPHNRCNCHCVMCDIWRIRQERELSVEDLAPHLASIRALGVRHVAFSGGEPQLHSDLPGLIRLLRAEGVRVTLLTAGLLLETHAESVAKLVDDVTVSLDGPPEIHDRIRRVPHAFQKLEAGVRALRVRRHDLPISGRCTVQKLNFEFLSETVEAARWLGLSSISFLAADLSSPAFNRLEPWTQERQAQVALEEDEAARLETEIEFLIGAYSMDIARKFIAESPGKLRRIVRHFQAHLGLAAPVSPACNAPWVSAVIETDGSVKPCFFHPSIGNLRDGPLNEVLNSGKAMAFRSGLHVASNPVCQNCVCSLKLGD